MSTDFSRVSFYTWEQKKRRARECLFFREDMMFNKDSTTTRREFVKRVGAVAGATLFLGQRTLWGSKGWPDVLEPGDLRNRHEDVELWDRVGIEPQV
jgi:hypothetical protein